MINDNNQDLRNIESLQIKLASTEEMDLTEAVDMESLEELAEAEAIDADEE